MRSFLAVLRSLTLPYGAGPGTPRTVIGPNVPACLNPITNGVPSTWNGRSAVGLIQMFNTGTDFEFIAEILSSSGTQRTFIVTGRAASEAAGASVAINMAQAFDTGLGVVSNILYGTVGVLDGDPVANGAANLQINQSRKLTLPLSVAFNDQNGNPHTSFLPVLGKRVMNGSGSSQAATGTITWLQVFGAAGFNQITPYPAFSNRQYEFEVSFMFNGTSVGSGIIVQIHRQVGGSPVPATDPVLATGRGTVGVANANDSRYFRQFYTPPADAVETYYASIFAFGAGTVTLVTQSDGSIFGLTNVSIRDTGSLT